jgi:uncharacterized membrane protein YeaQ/YmgE (transglycosylase-associated protein family)
LSEKTGLSEQQVTAQLSQLLPGLVDKLTPQGRLPTQGELGRFVGWFGNSNGDLPGAAIGARRPLAWSYARPWYARFGPTPRDGSRWAQQTLRCQRKLGGSTMGIISRLILGLIAGFIGSKIVNKSGQGFWLDIALGIVGAIVGGFLFSGVFGMEGITGLNIWSLIVAIIGSIVVLWGYHALAGRR